MNNRKRVAALLSAAMMLATAFNPSALMAVIAEDINYGPIHVVPNTLEVEKSDTSFMKQYPTGQTLKFSAARNERESGQIIIHSDKNIDEITVDKAALFNGSSKIPEENIEVFFEQYVEITDTNCGWLQEVKGFHADPLLPYAMAVDLGMNKLDTKVVIGKDANNNDIYANTLKNQGIWFTVTVPDDAKAGTYSGNFTVTLDEEVCTVPVEFTVYDFNLPEQTERITYFNDANAGNTKAISNAGYNNKNDYATEISQFLDERRMSTGWPGKDTGWNTADKFEAALQEYTEAVFNHVTSSHSPYYLIEPDYEAATYTNKFDKVDFKLDLLEEAFKKYATVKSNAEQLYQNKDERKKYINEQMYSKLNIEGLENQINAKYDDLIKIFTEIKQEQESNREIDLSDAEMAAIKYSLTEFMYYNVKYCTGMLSDAEKKLIADCPGEGTEYYRNTYETITSDNYTKYEYIDKLRTDERYYPQNQDAWLELLYTGMMLYNAKYYKTENTQSKSEEFGILKLARNFGTRGLDRYYQEDHPHVDGEVTICLPGLQTILMKLAEKSLETGTDLLKYAYFKSGAIDEVQRSDFWGAYEALNASFVLESSKDEVEKYILNYKGSNEPFKTQLRESLDNLHFMITNCSVDRKMIPYTNGYFHIDDAPAYFSMLANGLEYLGFDDLEDYYPRERYTTDSHDETQIDYITVPKNHTIQCFCSLFNDFSPTMPPYCSPDAVSKDLEGAKKSLENFEKHIWWYNCMSEGNPLLAGFFIGGNTGYIKCEKNNGYSIQGNSLAITRANVWQQYAMGIEGELYWMIDDLIGEEDLWQKPNDCCNCTRLVYPLNPFKTKLKNNTVKDKYGSFASCIRLENLSEATDDYDYLYLAEQGVMQHPEYRDRLNNIICSLIEPGNVNYSNSNLTNSENIAKAKNELALLIMDCNSMDVQEVLPTTKHSYAVPQVENWHSSGKMLCFDIFATDTVQINDSRHFSISLADAGSNRLNELLTVDYTKKTISGCEQANLLSHNNGWYTVQIPLMYVPLNTSGNLYQASGKETLTKIYFQYINCSFYVSNFQVFQEVTNDHSNRFLLSDAGMPAVTNWKQSSKILSFDVCPTKTYQSDGGIKTATLSLTSNGNRLNELIILDFANLTVSNCDGAEMLSQHNGWFTVRIPLKNAVLNSTGSHKADGTETMDGILFIEKNVSTSFLVDHIHVYQEVTNQYNNAENFNNMFHFEQLGIPSVDQWKTSGQVLCFDVCPTNSYRADDREQTVSLSLAQDWDRLNEPIKLDFANLTVSNCLGAVMLPTGNGWYTVQIPLGNVKMKTSDISGTETLDGIHFKASEVHISFLLDNIKLLHDVTNVHVSKPHFSNYFFFSEFDAPEVSKWKTSNQILCFDVYETDTYHNANGIRKVSLSLRADQQRLNELMDLNFQNLTVSNCEGAKIISNGNGWYTVEIPLDNVKVNTSGSNFQAEGTETIDSILFIKDYVYTSFMLDNIKIYQAAKIENQTVVPRIVIHAAPKKTNSFDINDDGRVSIADAVLLSRYVGEDSTVKMPEAGKSRVDCNGDGIVDMSDVVKILRVIARLD